MQSAPGGRLHITYILISEGNKAHTGGKIPNYSTHTHTCTHKRRTRTEKLIICRLQTLMHNVCGACCPAGPADQTLCSTSACVCVFMCDWKALCLLYTPADLHHCLTETSGEKQEIFFTCSMSIQKACVCVCVCLAVAVVSRGSWFVLCYFKSICLWISWIPAEYIKSSSARRGSRVRTQWCMLGTKRLQSEHSRNKNGREDNSSHKQTNNHFIECSRLIGIEACLCQLKLKNVKLGCLDFFAHIQPKFCNKKLKFWAKKSWWKLWDEKRELRFMSSL